MAWIISVSRSLPEMNLEKIFYLVRVIGFQVELNMYVVDCLRYL